MVSEDYYKQDTAQNHWCILINEIHYFFLFHLFLLHMLKQNKKNLQVYAKKFNIIIYII